MSKKLAVIISSIAAAVVAVVGVVFAGVWGTNTGVSDNTITVGTPATVTLSGSAMNSTILPGTPVESAAYTVDIANAGGATFKLVLTKDAATTANLANFKVQVKVGAGTYGAEMALADTVDLLASVADDDVITLKFTFSADAAVTEATKALVFDLALVQTNA